MFYASEVENLTSSCKVLPTDPNAMAYLLFDGSTKTGANVKNGTIISFTASKPIRGIYLVWDTPHAQWDFISLKNGEETRRTYGENGFLHEYADLGDNYDSVTLEFHGNGAILCDIYAFSEGDVPDWVQIWQPPLEKADLLVLPARAGDEFLYFGGVIPYYIAKGKSVQAAYMTNLFNEPLKTHGILNALYTSGLRHYPVTSGFPEITAASVDAALERYDEDGFLAFTTELLRRFKPEVVVGQGEYGDGVQMLSASALMIAAELSGDMLEYRESAKEYGEWDVPKVYLHGYDENGIEMDWSGSLGTAESAFSHYTWRQNRSIVTGGAYDCRKFGLFRTTVGVDVKRDDLFENIKPPNSSEPEPEAKPEAETELDEPRTVVAERPQTPDKTDFLMLAGSHAAVPLVAVLMITVAILLRRKKD